MKILVLPLEKSNPYQDLLYGAMRPHGAQVSYLARLTPFEDPQRPVAAGRNGDAPAWRGARGSPALGLGVRS